jgi:hypothetical protein
MFRDSSAVVPSLVPDGRAPTLGAFLRADAMGCRGRRGRSSGDAFAFLG